MLVPTPFASAATVPETYGELLKQSLAMGRAIGVCEVVPEIGSLLQLRPLRTRRKLAVEVIGRFAVKTRMTPKEFTESCKVEVLRAPKLETRIDRIISSRAAEQTTTAIESSKPSTPDNTPQHTQQQQADEESE